MVIFMLLLLIRAPFLQPGYFCLISVYAYIHTDSKSCIYVSFDRAYIQKLEVELSEYRQGKVVVGTDGNVVLNDITEENTMLRAENDK